MRSQRDRFPSVYARRSLMGSHAMTEIDHFRQQHGLKSEADLMILREATHKGSVEHQVVLSLLHEREVLRQAEQHQRTRRLTMIAIAVSVIGALVGISSCLSNRQLASQKQSVSPSTTHTQPTPTQPAPLPKQTP